MKEAGLRDGRIKNNVEIDDEEGYEGKAADARIPQGTVIAPVAPKQPPPNTHDDLLEMDLGGFEHQKPEIQPKSAIKDDFDLYGDHIPISEPRVPHKINSNVDILDFDFNTEAPKASPMDMEPKRPGIFDISEFSVKKLPPNNPSMELIDVELEPSEFQESWEEYENRQNN